MVLLVPNIATYHAAYNAEVADLALQLRVIARRNGGIHSETVDTVQCLLGEDAFLVERQNARGRWNIIRNKLNAYDEGRKGGLSYAGLMRRLHTEGIAP